MKYLSFCAAALAAAVSTAACGPVSDESADDFSDELSADELSDESDGLSALSKGHEDATSVTAVDPARELLITDLSVVEDPLRTTWPVGTPTGDQAAWTFGRLMQSMAGSQDVSQFVLQWLRLFEQDQIVNGHTAAARPLISSLLIDPWLLASGGTTLDMRKAPFRLLAIVSRLDLRTSAAGKVNAGEGRFIFGALKPDGSPMPVTIILEYGMPAKSGKDVKAWATKWHALGKIPFGQTYNKELMKLTKRFSDAGCAPSKPNGSCINQIRTNEAPFHPSLTWDLREYRLSPATGKLVEVVTVQTPDASLNGTEALATFINANANAAKLRKHVVPSDQLALSVPATMTRSWNAPGILDNDARHGFALTTCNGCHTTETGTAFLHVKNRESGHESQLSAFMTGTVVADPVSGVQRSFSELASRAVDMQFVLSSKNHEIFGNDDDDNDD